MATQPNAGRDIEADGPKVVRCPGCGQERWHGVGPCSNCGAPGTATDEGRRVAEARGLTGGAEG
jgi:hypothetical protein